MLLLLRAPNLSRLPIFAAGFLCTASLATDALRAGPTDSRPSPNSAVGAALNARSGPFTELYFTQVFGKSPFDRVGLYEILAESREAIKKETPGPALENPQKTGSSRRVFLSGAWRERRFEIFFGRRQRPGPDSAWDLDPNALSLLPAVSHGRNTAAGFLRPRLGPGVPGFFWLEGVAGTGLYFADERERVRIAWHPVRREGALALDLPLPLASFRSRLFADVVQTRGAWSGYLRAAGKDAEGSRFLVEAERRLAWDDPPSATPSARFESALAAHAADVLPRRRGRGGAVSAFVQWEDRWQAEAAGQDRGYDAYRVAGATAFLPPASALYLALRLRYYERRDYRPDAPASLWNSPALALGLGWRAGPMGLVLYGESRRAAAPLAELEIYAETEAGRLGLAAAYSRETGTLSYMFLRSPGVLESGARYYEGQGALRLYLQADWLYFGVESRAAERGYERRVFLQARLTFN